MRKYSIFQINYRNDYRFMDLEFAKGHGFNFDDYSEVGSGIIEDDNKSVKQILNELFGKYNMDIPYDYNGRSMSVSDIVMIEDGNNKSFHYVNSFGFDDVTDLINM